MKRSAHRDEVLRLRVEERLSFAEIHKKLGVSKGSISNWLKDYPLSPDELAERLSRANGKRKTADSWSNKPASALQKLLGERTLSPTEKARISETAVLLRLLVRGYTVYSSPFEGDKVDWVVRIPSGKLVQIQVKTGQHGEYGAPFVKLRCADGRGKLRRYVKGEFDFVVGYDLYTDAAYVWSWDDVAEQESVSFEDSAAEAWDKLGT